MKPAINKKVYTLCSYELHEETVGYLGEKSFVINNFYDYQSDFEFNYDDFEVTWFTSFKKAMSKLKRLAKTETRFKTEIVEANDYHGKWWYIGDKTNG